MARPMSILRRLGLDRTEARPASRRLRPPRPLTPALVGLEDRVVPAHFGSLSGPAVDFLLSTMPMIGQPTQAGGSSTTGTGGNATGTGGNTSGAGSDPDALTFLMERSTRFAQASQTAGTTTGTGGNATTGSTYPTGPSPSGFMPPPFLLGMAAQAAGTTTPTLANTTPTTTTPISGTTTTPTVMVPMMDMMGFHEFGEWGEMGEHHGFGFTQDAQLATDLQSYQTAATNVVSGSSVTDAQRHTLQQGFQAIRTAGVQVDQTKLATVASNIVSSIASGSTTNPPSSYQSDFVAAFTGTADSSGALTTDQQTLVNGAFDAFVAVATNLNIDTAKLDALTTASDAIAADYTRLGINQQAPTPLDLILGDPLAGPLIDRAC